MIALALPTRVASVVSSKAALVCFLVQALCSRTRGVRSTQILQVIPTVTALPRPDL